MVIEGEEETQIQTVDPAQVTLVRAVDPGQVTPLDPSPNVENLEHDKMRNGTIWRG